MKATVRLPADAENYRVQLIAEGKRTQTVAGAMAEAERIKKIGAAEASAIEVVGKAEAEKMRMKAAVYKQYGDAAIMNIVLDSLPKVRGFFSVRCFRGLERLNVAQFLSFAERRHWSCYKLCVKLEVNLFLIDTLVLF